MRIISGSLKGRILDPPLNKWPTRPTTDMAREALFNILANRIDYSQSVMLDLFGGTGAHMFEFLSRGCVDTTYVDKHGKCVSWVKQQLHQLHLEDYAKVIRMDVSKFICKTDRKFSYIFVDPPYALNWLVNIPQLIFDYGLLIQGGILIIEHGNDKNLEAHSRFVESRKYGQSVFSFFE